MADKPGANAARKKQDALRLRFWPKDIPWRGAGAGEKGWFSAPRTFPLILTLLDSKDLTNKRDVSRVLLDLYARQMGQGVVVMGEERDHAYSSGFSDARGPRSWRERMALLDELGFIKVESTNGKRYGVVFLVHPTVAIQTLQEKGRVPKEWWNTYQQRQIELNERSFEDVAAEDGEPSTSNVLPMTRQG